MFIKGKAIHRGNIMFVLFIFHITPCIRISHLKECGKRILKLVHNEEMIKADAKYISRDL